MNRTIEIIPLDEYTSTTFYTIKFIDEEDSEYDKFCEKFDGNIDFGEDFDIIIHYLDRIGEEGAIDVFLRPEGGSLKAVPADPCALRLYCFRVNPNILIIGNGGHKPRHIKTYQDSKELNKYICDLRESCRKLMSKMKYRSAQANIYNGKLYGDLIFDIETINL